MIGWRSDGCSSDLRDRDLEVVPAGQRRIGGRVCIDAQQRERARARGRVFPGQLRVAAAAKAAWCAKRELRRDRAVAVEAAAVDAHRVPLRIRFRDSPGAVRSEEHTSELQSLMRISYAVFCLKKKNNNTIYNTLTHI